jgi:DNA repair ATPase RecN
MARTKRTSTVLETARQRLAGLKSITPAPNFGATLTLVSYEADIQAVNDKLDSYNEQLSSLDQSQNELDSLELALREKNTRILSAAEAHYGPDSTEYEQAGGTRRSERKRPGPKGPRTPPPPTA